MIGSPRSVTFRSSCAGNSIRSVIDQSRTIAARGQVRARHQRGSPCTCLSGGVFSAVLVSQMTRACRAALTNPGFAGTERGMLAPCPHLPPPRPGLDWRSLNAFRGAGRGTRFYYACLEYANALWQRSLAARAILCLDRAMGADLKGDEAVLSEWPLPYAAIAWFMRHSPHGVFIGNPRVHFQHYADRMNEPRKEQRRWRAWACWAIARRVLPDLPGDPRHKAHIPTLRQIEAGLKRHGIPGEAELWLREFSRAGG